MPHLLKSKLKKISQYKLNSKLVQRSLMDLRKRKRNKRIDKSRIALKNGLKHIAKTYDDYTALDFKPETHKDLIYSQGIFHFHKAPSKIKSRQSMLHKYINVNSVPSAPSFKKPAKLSKSPYLPLTDRTVLKSRYFND